jgi:hypothetical protein
MENDLPVASIDSISPTTAASGETVTFTGHGDADGSIVDYRWRSSIDGDLSASASFDSDSLSEGVHTIYFKVQDDNESWSDEAESTLTIGAAAATSPTEESTDESRPGTPGESGTSAGMPYIDYFTADPGAISPGDSSTVSWSVSNAESITIDYGVSVDTVPPTGTATVNPTATTTYTLTATGGGATVSATVDIVVSGSGAPPPAGASMPVIDFFTASPDSIPSGGSSTLSYSVANADTITLSSTAGSKVASLIYSSSSLSVEPTSTTTYTITATNTAGTVTATATVTVSAPAAVKTKEFHLVTSESGSINSDHVVGPKLIAGDAGTNKTSWAYFSFNISTIAGKEVTGAQLFYSPSALTGKSWPDLVSLGIYQINHGPRPLQPGDYAFIGPTIAEGLSQIQTIVPVDVTSQVQTAVSARAPRFQVRLNFVRMTDNDGKPDNISWTSSTPKLRVTYR